MELVELIRRHAARRLSASRLAAEAQGVGGGWARAEGSVQQEVLSSPRRARRLVHAFRDVAAAHGGNEPLGRAARLEGSFEAYLGRFAESLPHYHEAARLLRAGARDAARLGSASSLLRLGRFDEAVTACRAVRRAARRRGEGLLAAAADLNEAVARHESGAPGRALALYERAESGFREARRPALAATALQNRANALVLLDRFSDAEPLYRRAQHAFDELGVTNEAARCRYNVGALLAATDRLGDADRELRQAEIALVAAGDARQAALTLVDRAEVLLRAGLATEARQLARRAARAMGRGVPPAERCRGVLIEARALLTLGRSREASRRLRRAFPRDLPMAESARQELLARAVAAGGRHGAAAAALRSVARRHRRDQHPVGAARALCAAAWSSVQAGDLPAARRDLRGAARDQGEIDLPSLTHAREAVAFLTAVDSGRRADADRALTAALAALERVRAGLGLDAFRAAALRGREAWFARAVRYVLERPDGVTDALELLERWRARALRDLLAGAAELAESAAPPDALRAEIARLERALGGGVGAALLRGRTVELPAAAYALSRAEARLRDALRLSAPDAAPVPSVAELRAALPPGTLVISLFADDEGALLFGLARESVRLVRTPTPTREVARLVEALRFQLGQHELGADFARRHAARLARRVDSLLGRLGAVTFEPLSAEIRRARRVIVVPHGPWHHAPLAALHVDGEPLVSHVDVALAPAVGALLSKARRARGKPVVLAAADATAPDLAREARAVSRLVGGRLHEGGDARMDLICSHGAPALLHVSAHGRYRPDAPALSGVRLADGWLRAAEFPTLALRGSTVVLSGCETGLTPVTAGDEIQGLVRGVFASGANELVASLWRVDDPATTDLMVRMHRARRDGAAADAALCQAQRVMLGRGLPVWAWAGFQTWTRRLR